MPQNLMRAVISCATVGLTGVAHAQVSGAWAVNSGGAFGSAVNWTSNPSVPGGGGVATFGPVATVPIVVTLNASPTLRGIVFNDAVGSYTLVAAGSNAITLAQSVVGDNPRIDVQAGTHTINVPLAGTATLIKDGAGTLVLGGASTYVGDTSVYNGVLRVASANALGPAGPGNAVGVQGGGVLELANVDLGVRDVGLFATSTPGGTLRAVTGSNAIGGNVYLGQSAAIGVDAAASLALTGNLIDNGFPGANTLSKVGPGTLNVRRFGGGPFGANGSALPVASLAVDAGVARVVPNGSDGSTSRLNGLTVAAGASLDLSDDALVIDYGSASPLGTIRDYLYDGRLTATGVGAKRVGYAEASALGLTGSTFAGQPVDATSIVARAVAPGDANLDGAVDFADLLKLSQYYGTSDNGASWSDGDFDYTGAVDFVDLLTLAQNYAPVGITGTFVTGAPNIFATDWGLAAALVPEPRFTAFFAAFAGFSSRRSRKFFCYNDKKTLACILLRGTIPLNL